MVFNNEKNIIGVKIQKLLVAIAAGAIIIVLLTTNLVADKFMGVSDKQWAVVVGVAYVLYFLFQLYLEPTYLYFSDDGKNIVLRFYKSSSYNPQKVSIEIPKTEFLKFETIKSVINRKEQIIVYQKKEKGIYKYPPICLSVLKPKEKKMVKDALRKYAKAAPMP